MSISESVRAQAVALNYADLKDGDFAMLVKDLAAIATPDEMTEIVCATKDFPDFYLDDRDEHNRVVTAILKCVWGTDNNLKRVVELLCEPAVEDAIGILRYHYASYADFFASNAFLTEAYGNLPISQQLDLIEAVLAKLQVRLCAAAELYDKPSNEMSLVDAMFDDLAVEEQSPAWHQLRLLYEVSIPGYGEYSELESFIAGIKILRHLLDVKTL